MKNKKIFLVLALIIFALSLTGCKNSKPSSSNNKSQTKNETTVSDNENKDLKVIKVGVDSFQSPAVFACEEAMKDRGYKLETVVFDDNMMPNEAVMEGSIDANMYQHKPFMESFNKSKHGKLVMKDPILYLMPVGLYSSKYKTIDEIPDGGIIVLGNDPSNIDRALQMLDELKLIELGEKKEEFYSVFDVSKNPKNLDLKTVATTTVINNMDDCDAVVAYATTIFAAGKDPESALAFDSKSKDTTWGIGVCVREDRENEEWVQDLIDSFKDEKTWEKIYEHFKGAYVKAY